MKKVLCAIVSLLSIGSCIPASNHAVPKRKLPVQCKKPNLSDDQIIGYSMGIRPCRISGVRLETEHVKDKIIIHNYGHGGSGITLSWGCAEHVLELLEQERVETRSIADQPIAVVGAGIIGLSVAHVLLDKGYRVNIYAKDFPPHITASVGSGAIRPFGLGEGQDQVLLKKMHDISRVRFEKYAHEKKPEFGGVKYIADFKIRPGIKAVEDKTLVVQTTQYLDDLFEKAKQKGAQFIYKIFQTKDEVTQLSESIIINCTGYGARDLFSDQDLLPIRGHTVLLAPQEGINYIAGDLDKKDGIFTSLTPHDDKIVIAGSYEENVDSKELDEAICKKILEQARAFFNEIEFE
ncbi:FAD-dependent oxidoreductase [Candidatus Dependentiae bacterium]|jgi:D-amino-acid oxidase|nr:FAD-dependent oxidoreductase [Candidatus Dependentiae bacterium]